MKIILIDFFYTVLFFLGMFSYSSEPASTSEPASNKACERSFDWKQLLIGEGVQWTNMREKWISAEKNPEVYLEELVGIIPQHIEHIREKIDSLVKQDKRRWALEHLEQEFENVKNKKAVTYRWWLSFNFALLKVLSSKYEETLNFTSFNPSPDFDDITKVFPQRILMPTIKSVEQLGGEKGVEILRTKGIDPIYLSGHVLPDGRINSPFTELKNAKMTNPTGFTFRSPEPVSETDNDKVGKSDKPRQREEEEIDFLRKLSELESEERENVEAIYSILEMELEMTFDKITVQSVNRRKKVIVSICTQLFAHSKGISQKHRHNRATKAFNDFINLLIELNLW